MSNSKSVASQPTWWEEKHSTAWERTKAALQRDWEQTKRDFSGSHGRDLNQDASDTFRQAAGKQHIPSEITPNTPSDADMKRHQKAADKAQEAARNAEEHARQRRLDGKDPQKADERAADARLEAVKKDAELAHNRSLKWDDVERPVRYGYGAGIHYRNEWDNEFEDSLRNEWTSLNRDEDWRSVRDSVRYGFDRARGFKDI